MSLHEDSIWNALELVRGRITELEAALKRIACMMEEISPTLYQESQIWCEATEALRGEILSKSQTQKRYYSPISLQ